MRIIRATDMGDGFDLDRFAGPDVDPWIYMEGCEAWAMVPDAEARIARHDPDLARKLGIGEATCPTCKGGDIARKRYCLRCDRTGLDGRALFPGKPIDSEPDEDWFKSEAGGATNVNRAG